VKGIGQGVVHWRALTVVMEDLAKQIARDGEGAKKLVTIDVEGTRTRKRRRGSRGDCEFAAGEDGDCGADPNWGRIMWRRGMRAWISS
jgi:glutamate N-acetyltransferase / amino-acid N-acetyltransferase